MNRERISSGSTFEQEYAYSRVVAQCEWIFVSGTTGFDYASMTVPEGVVAQAEQCFANIEAALANVHATFDDIVRVTYYLADKSDFAACAPVIRKHLETARPATTMIEAGLLDPRLKIEIETTALRRPGG